MAKTKSTFLETVRVGAGRRITIPSRIAKALRLKKGDPVLIRLVDCHIHLIPTSLIPKDQLWFWTPEWQKKEREVDEDISQGRVKETASINELIRDLKS